MGNAINLTPYAVGELAGKDAEGFPLHVAVVKATWQWQQDGSLRQIAAVPICESDEFAGEPATSGLLAATDLAPPKPRVDVLFKGTLTFPAPMTEVDVAVRVGTRTQKAAHVFGARYWLPGVVHDMAPSKPYPTDALPFAWEWSFGGMDLQDTRATEPRNPAGTGVTKRPTELQGKQAPSFEDPASPIKSSNDRPAPRGFGPVAAHWQPRCQLAGTYDEAWHIYSNYKENLLGVISDIEYPMAGVCNPEAGLELTRRIKLENPDMPVLLQSSNSKFAGQAGALGASFMHKAAPDLSKQLRAFILRYFGFGDFVFSDRNGAEFARASDLHTML